MCRSNSEGGRRCLKHNAYGRKQRNLQAKKQYHTKKGDLAEVEAVKKKMDELKSYKNYLLQDGGTLKPYTMNLTPAAEKVLKGLVDDGLEPYVVGGSVRDALLSLDSKDVDIEVYKATPDQVVASLRKIGNVDEVGKAFGVLKIQVDGEDFDVSLPRKDSLSGDGGHRGFTVEVTPELSLYDATARRDYTVNALMYDHQMGFIIDKHGGLEDMENRTLRHVSEAYDEDPLRVLRAVQMASRFTMELHPDTVVKAQTLKDQYSTLAVERVQIEFQKMYEKGKAPDKSFKLLKATQWDENFPGLKAVNNSDLHRELSRVKAKIADKSFTKEETVTTVSAVVASKLNDNDAMQFLKVTTVGDDMKNKAFRVSRLQLPQKQGKSSLRQWAYDMPRNVTVKDWVNLHTVAGDSKKAAEVAKKAEKLGILNGPAKDLVNGDDLLKSFPDRKPGRWVKNALTVLRQAQYSDQFTDRESGLKWLEANKNQFSAA